MKRKRVREEHKTKKELLVWRTLTSAFILSSTNWFPLVQVRQVQIDYWAEFEPSWLQSTFITIKDLLLRLFHEPWRLKVQHEYWPICSIHLKLMGSLILWHPNSSLRQIFFFFSCNSISSSITCLLLQYHCLLTGQYQSELDSS